MKTALILSTLMLSVAARAEVWFVPQLESAQQLWLANPTDSDEPVWVSPPYRGGDYQEADFVVPARGALQVPAKDLGSEWAQVKSRRGHKVSVLLKQNGAWSSLAQGRANRRTMGEGRGQALFVTNLSPIRQEGLILIQSRKGELRTESVSLEAFARKKISLPETEFMNIEVRGSLNILAHVMTGENIEVLATAESAPYRKGDAARFLLADPNRTQSYVVELTDPKMIEKARLQLERPDEFMGRILIATIAMGSGSVNQDLVNPLKGTWSWHIEKPLAFAEMASVSCEGSPDMVEDLMSSWMESGSKICFWNYRIVEELGPDTTELAP